MRALTAKDWSVFWAFKLHDTSTSTDHKHETCVKAMCKSMQFRDSVNHVSCPIDHPSVSVEVTPKRKQILPVMWEESRASIEIINTALVLSGHIVRIVHLTHSCNTSLQ